MIFFDIDNTLLDQRRAEAAAAGPFLAEYGARLEQRLSIDRFCRLWRCLRDKHVRDFLRGRISAAEQRRRRVRELFSHRPIGDAEADHVYAFFEEHYCAGWTLYDDVLPCLRSLAGLPLGIISNGSMAKQRDKLRATAIEKFFSLLVISEEAGAAKPHRKIFLEACRRAGRPSAECTYVGDRFEADALASRAAGMHGLWLNRRGDGLSPCSLMLRSLDELIARLPERIAA